ncbi:MAG: ABC transporter permease [Sandaracinaceae bacterium]|nr:ABC transporter permease [Sandaracinaceae bacterium]
MSGSVILLLVTVIFVARVLAHVTPLILDLVESFDFRTMMSARMLRAGKSGFLTTIGILSILAVTVASAAPSIVLSIMGGFRQDLKRKILGNNAHIVIDRDHGNFEGWSPLLERTRAVPGVTGAAPYVAGEVMISSSSNLAGAVLHGIDPELINQVTDLNRNIRSGRMDYLVHPERLLHLSPAEVNAAPLPLANALTQRIAREVEAQAAEDALDGVTRDAGVTTGTARPINPRGSVINDIDSLIHDEDTHQPRPAAPVQDDPRDDGLDQFLLPAADLTRPREVLPGVIIGQELARTLRLFLGDEVNVVSPFGGLGPTGPVPKSRTFRVAGIFYSGMYEYDMKFVYMMLPIAQEFLSTGDGISGIEVKVADMEHAPEIGARIAQTLHRSELRVRDWQEVNRNLFGALALEKLAMFLALGIAIIVAGFCVFGTLTLMVQEKSKQVGVLKAMGTTPRSIVAVFLSEGLLIGIFGASLGLGVGYVVCFAFEHFGVRMNPEVYYIDRLPISIDPVEFTLVALSSVVVCLLATVFPAILASRVSPIDALRHD